MYNSEDETNSPTPTVNRRRPQKKITPQRLKNIGLYYLKRFESSAANLRFVLRRRIDAYARENPQYDKNQAYQWAEDVINEFERLHYLDDARFAEMKIRNYLNSGKPERYIKMKLREKGIDEQLTDTILNRQQYNPLQMALKLAKRKKIGPYRPAEQQREFRNKDMGTLARAGFDYDIVCEVLNFTADDTDDDL